MNGMKLYGKDEVISLIGSMIERDRLYHSFIFTGEQGTGKKTVARYLAKMILCKGWPIPCGVCKSCIMCDGGGHPDICELEPSGKSHNYRADDLRFLISDASTAANEGGYKIYIIPEIDRALTVAQNTLLKIIEEPPKNVIFIMTAESKEKILPTVLSRSIEIAMPPISSNDCISALIDKGYSKEDASRAVRYFGGSIGECIAYLSGDGSAFPYEVCGRILDALNNADEYALLKEISSLDGDRQVAIKGIELLESAIRDCIAAKHQGLAISAGMSDKTKELAKCIRTSGFERMYLDCKEAREKILGNANTALTLADLACKLRIHSLR